MVELSRFLFLLCLMFLLTLSTVESLRLKMIPSDSIDSPFYPGNLTNVEKLQRLDNHSIATVQYYKAMLSQSDFNTEQLRPRVTFHYISFHYVVELTVGTLRGTRGRGHNSYKFVLDASSDLMWLLCEPCHNCWRREGFFVHENSVSYMPVKCDHHLCDLNRPGWACIRNQCHYTFHYVASKAAIGFLGTELIGFSSNPQPTEFITPLVFGCTHETQGDFGHNEDIDGVLGLNPLPLSLITQIQHHVGGHQFAYCLTFLTSSPLLLGHEAVLHGPHVKTIHIGWFPGYGPVHLPLRDVSVGTQRINFAPGTFEPRMVGNRAHGGFLVDTGSPVTHFMSGGPYEQVMGAFRNHFQHRPFDYVGPQNGFELCYHIRGPSDFPNMVLHFEGQDFIVQPENLILKVGDDAFCVTIRHMEGISLFGAYQQKDHWMSFDYAGQTLSFAPEDCSQYA